MRGAHSPWQSGALTWDPNLSEASEACDCLCLRGPHPPAAGPPGPASPQLPYQRAPAPRSSCGLLARAGQCSLPWAAGQSQQLAKEMPKIAPGHKCLHSHNRCVTKLDHTRVLGRSLGAHTSTPVAPPHPWGLCGGWPRTRLSCQPLSLPQGAAAVASERHTALKAPPGCPGHQSESRAHG